MVRTWPWMSLVVAGYAVAAALASPGSPGPRPSVVVVPFNNGSVGRPSEEIAPLAHGIADLLGRAVAQNAAVRVVDRGQLDRLLKSPPLGGLGVVDREVAARIAHLVGARHAIFGGFIADEHGTLRLDVRAVDAQTSTIEYVETMTDDTEGAGEMIGRFAAQLTARLRLPRAEPPPGGAAGTANVAGSSPVAPVRGVVAGATGSPALSSTGIVPATTASPSPHIGWRALLAYSRGLAAADAGNRAAADAYFTRVLAEHPAFEPAQHQLRRVRAAGPTQ